MGISAQQMLGNDPEYLGRQLRQQQIQNYMAPFQSQQDRTAGLLGGLLGGGIAAAFSKPDAYKWSVPLGLALGVSSSRIGCR